MLAECLSSALGYRCIDRDTLVRTAATRRATEYDLRAALEEPPAFPGRFNHTRYVYLALIQAALAEQVRNGRAIYHGLGGHLLLKGAPGLLRLRIIAPMEFRVARAQERVKLNRSDAIEYIRSMDRDRRRWTQFLYGVDWSDPSLYDMLINLEYISIDQACRQVVSLVEEGSFELSPERQAALNDFVLACRIRAELAQNPHTLNLEVEVECRAGSVTVWGDSLEDADAIETVVRSVAGVTDVTTDARA
jgi:hypothetical protein